MAFENTTDFTGEFDTKDPAVRFILSHITAGVNLVKAKFDRLSDPNPHCLPSLNMADEMRYTLLEHAIKIPITFLQSIAKRASNGILEKITIEGDDFTPFILFSTVLKAAGMEETIHYLQDIGDPKITAPFVEDERDTIAKLNGIGRLLCRQEVEARQLTDIILKENGIAPIHHKFDQYLKTTYPKEYGESIKTLCGLDQFCN